MTAAERLLDRAPDFVTQMGDWFVTQMGDFEVERRPAAGRAATRPGRATPHRGAPGRSQAFPVFAAVQTVPGRVAASDMVDTRQLKICWPTGKRAPTANGRGGGGRTSYLPQRRVMPGGRTASTPFASARRTITALSAARARSMPQVERGGPRP